MKVYETKDLRNVALIGHGGSGKTTLAEAMAFNAGLIDRMGKVEEGTTVSDFTPEEINRNISINATPIPIEFKNKKINILDVPGYFDFTGDMISTLKVVDSAIILADAVSGVEVGTEKACIIAKDYSISTVIMINKLDRENANFSKTIKELRDILGNKIVPFEIPMGEAQNFKGVINVVDMTARERRHQKCIEVNIPSEMEAEIAPYREMIMEAVAQTSEELMEKYFNGEDLTTQEIYTSLRKGVLEGELIPVVCGSTMQNVGVETLMNFIIEFLPSPQDIIPVQGTNPKNKELVERTYKSSEPFSGIVFKTIADPYVGKLSLFKVVSGTLCPSDEIYNSCKDKKEKQNNLYILQGKNQVDVTRLHAGDIGAFSKLQYTMTGDTICDSNNPIIFESIEFPKSIISQAIFPKSKGDEDKIGVGLQRLVEEDPTFKIYRNNDTKETIISGMGEMHLEIISERLKNKFGVEVVLKDPKIPYKETIRNKSKSEGKHKKQSGGRGQYGHIFIECEPILEEEKEFEFVDKVVGGAVPRQYIPAVEKGLKECLIQGVLAGYPVTGVRFTLYDGSFHSVDSDEMSFKMAASLAYKKGLKEATPVLLEPVHYVEVDVPDDYMGDIMGDLNKKRGRILGIEPLEGRQKIMAEVPLSEMSKYATELRSMTQARGEFMMEFARYEEVPNHLSEKIIETIKTEN